MKYNEITKEAILKAMEEFDIKDGFIEEVYPGCFKLPGGGYTGIGGVKLIHEQMKKHFEENLNKALENEKGNSN